MSSPFDKSAVLEVTMSRSCEKTRNSSFRGAGKLLCVVDQHGFATHFVLPGGNFMKPDEVNQILESMGSTVRVDENGCAYDTEEVIGAREA